MKKLGPPPIDRLFDPPIKAACLSILRAIVLAGCSLVLLAGCAPEEIEEEQFGEPRAFTTPYVCQDRDRKQVECDEKDRKMIDGINFIIKAVINFDSVKDLNKKFRHFFHQGKGAPVYFLGEQHNDVIAMIETLGFLNDEAQNGGRLLFEGADRTIRKIGSCAWRLIYRIYIAWEWEKLGLKYDAFKKSAWEQKEGFWNRFLRTLPSYDTTGLDLNKLSCGFWDDAKSIREGGVSAKLMKRRNESMVEAIKENRRDYPDKNIYIMTGYLHMPLGERWALRKINPQQKRSYLWRNDYFDAFYQMLRTENAKPLDQRSYRIFDGAGTTEVIYQYLRRENVTYHELIHRSLRF